MRKKSRRTGSVYCCEVINAAAWPGSAGGTRRWQSPLPPNRLPCTLPGTGVRRAAEAPVTSPKWRTVLAPEEHRFLWIVYAAYGHQCLCLGPSKSNISTDLCAPGSLCTWRQTGIFTGVCSHSGKNSQMGIILTQHTSWMFFIYNTSQHE